MPITVFKNEEILLELEIPAGYKDSEGEPYGSEVREYLIRCTSPRTGKPMLVACDREDRTDYPIVYGDRRVAYDWPEWFTENFRAQVAELAKLGRI